MFKAKRFIEGFASYALAGGLGTGVHYVVLYTLVELVGFKPTSASVGGALCGACVNYFLNRNLIFKSKIAHRRAAPRFFIIAGIALIINTAFMRILTQYFSTHYMLIQIGITAVLLLVTYFFNKRYTF